MSIVKFILCVKTCGQASPDSGVNRIFPLLGIPSWLLVLNGTATRLPDHNLSQAPAKVYRHVSVSNVVWEETEAKSPVPMLGSWRVYNGERYTAQTGVRRVWSGDVVLSVKKQDLADIWAVMG